MTIIVWDEETLVADKSTYKLNVVISNQDDKISEFPCKHFGEHITGWFSGTGSVTDILRLKRAWLNQFDKHNPLATVNDVDALNGLAFNDEARIATDDAVEGVLLLINAKTGIKKYYYVDSNLTLLAMPDRCAIGNETCVLVALGALDAGADAETACQIACSRTNMHVGSFSKVWSK